jgi:hypothetical protein
MIRAINLNEIKALMSAAADSGTSPRAALAEYAHAQGIEC